MSSPRYLTLLWPGLPWLWLRGSMAGLVLALAFAVVLDVALLLSCVWTALVEWEMVLGLWVATGAIWIVATGSALSAFPSPLPVGREAATEAQFVAARDAYLARDWLAAETHLRALLRADPTDGEAQLLLATLLRRARRLPEATAAFEKLLRSDAGAPWKGTIHRELQRIRAASDTPEDAAEPDLLPIASGTAAATPREAAA